MFCSNSYIYCRTMHMYCTMLLRSPTYQPVYDIPFHGCYCTIATDSPYPWQLCNNSNAKVEADARDYTTLAAQ